MAKREIQNLDLKIKLTNEYLNNGGVKKIYFKRLLEDLIKVKSDANGKVDPETVSPTVNAFMMGILHTHLEAPFYSPHHISEYSSTLQKALLFDQQNIDTEEQFDQVYDQYKNHENTLFRGQREAKWRLYSKLQRQWILEKLYENNGSYQTLLEALVINGLADYADKIKELLNEYNIDSDNDIAVLGFLQHHGCPTPLLDWTFKFQNALYFGIDGLMPKQNATEIEDYFSVYFIDENHFDGGSMRKVMTDSLSIIGKDIKREMINLIAENEAMRIEMEEKFKDRDFFDKSRFKGAGMIKHMTEIKRMVNFPITYFSDREVDSGIVFSLNNSKNILNQSGVFTWNADPSKPLEMTGNEQYAAGKKEDEPEDYRFCQCFNINKNLEGYIRKRLEADGITKDFIYPTVDIETYGIFEKSKKA